MTAARTSRTPLGRKLRELRKRIIAGGAKLLGWNELDAEVDSRRGERQPECTNCGAKATIIEAGVCICEECAEDIPKLLLPIWEARADEQLLQDWKDRDA